LRLLGESNIRGPDVRKGLPRGTKGREQLLSEKKECKGGGGGVGPVEANKHPVKKKKRVEKKKETASDPKS